MSSWLVINRGKHTDAMMEQKQRVVITQTQEAVDLVRFLGIARWDEGEASFFLVGDYTETGLNFEGIVEEVLQQFKDHPDSQSNTAANFETTLGYWYIKCLPDGYAYLVSTSKDYPPCVAIECLDDLSHTFENARVKRRNRPNPTDCCQEILEKYGTMEEGSLAWRLMTEIEEPVRNAYEEQLLVKMQHRLDNLQNKMHDNIMTQLENMETAESLQEKSDDLLLQAAVFKKNASKLPKKSFLNKRRVWVTAAGALAGAGIGIAMGGVGSPAAVPAGVAFAEGIEMTATALVFGASSNLAYVWAKRRWFAYQKLIRLDLSRINE